VAVAVAVASVGFSFNGRLVACRHLPLSARVANGQPVRRTLADDVEPAFFAHPWKHLLDVAVLTRGSPPGFSPAVFFRSIDCDLSLDLDVEAVGDGVLGLCGQVVSAGLEPIATVMAS
jgi:hypothetical protein